MTTGPYDAVNLGIPNPSDVLTTQPGDWNTDRALSVLAAAGFRIRRDDAWGLLRHLLQHAAAEPQWQQDGLFA
ncbi:hypothetical protein ABT282_38495 [Streptomyces sp. NPDC000927]|uniref:hypothetical protein n=1 Tax=Streptomyces sp. NPDC000927 TaxID=3154371 RepID=UPI00332571A8